MVTSQLWLLCHVVSTPKQTWRKTQLKKSSSCDCVLGYDQTSCYMWQGQGQPYFERRIRCWPFIPQTRQPRSHAGFQSKRNSNILLTKSIISQLRTFNLNLLLISFDSSIGTFHLDEGLGHWSYGLFCGCLESRVYRKL